MDGRKLGSILLTVVLIGLVLWLRMERRGEVGADAKAEAMALLTQAEGYNQNQKVYDGIAHLAHLGALDASYKEGGRRKPSSFDGGKYLSEFFERFINLARDQGQQDILKAVIKLRDANGIPRPQA